MRILFVQRHRKQWIIIIIVTITWCLDHIRLSTRSTAAPFPTFNPLLASHPQSSHTHRQTLSHQLLLHCCYVIPPQSRTDFITIIIIFNHRFFSRAVNSLGANPNVQKCCCCEEEFFRFQRLWVLVIRSDFFSVVQ